MSNEVCLTLIWTLAVEVKAETEIRERRGEQPEVRRDGLAAGLKQGDSTREQWRIILNLAEGEAYVEESKLG